jgi:hypothetical protein
MVEADKVVITATEYMQLPAVFVDALRDYLLIREAKRERERAEKASDGDRY